MPSFSRSVSVWCVLLSPKHASPRDHSATRLQLSKLHEYPLIRGVSLFYDPNVKKPLNKWMKYLNLSASACDNIPAPTVNGDAFIVGTFADYDLKQLYDDFPHINELIIQCYTGTIQRTHEHNEMKRKRAANETERQDQIQAKKLQARREAELAELE
jgi:hypothetical protein